MENQDDLSLGAQEYLYNLPRMAYIERNQEKFEMHLLNIFNQIEKYLAIMSDIAESEEIEKNEKPPIIIPSVQENRAEDPTRKVHDAISANIKSMVEKATKMNKSQDLIQFFKNLNSCGENDMFDSFSSFFQQFPPKKSFFFVSCFFNSL